MTQDDINKLAAAISANMAICQKEILTIDEAVIYTGLQKSYLYKLTSRRAIPHYKPTGRTCFFRRAELEEWMTANPVATMAELDGKALAHCMIHKNRF